MSEKPFILELGDWKFDHLDYDAHNDVLYASIGAPQPGYGEETPEGHILRFNDEGTFCGITLMGVERFLGGQ